jgi:hypothetical protein
VPAELPSQVARKAKNGLACPRAASQMPKATTVSVGSGGKTFSAAASTPSDR